MFPRHIALRQHITYGFMMSHLHLSNEYSNADKYALELHVEASKNVINLYGI